MTLSELITEIENMIYDWWDSTEVDDFMDGSMPSVEDLVEEIRRRGIKLNMDTKIDK